MTPNTRTHVALHLNTISRQEAPYTSKCISQWGGLYDFVNDAEPNLPYTVAVSRHCKVTVVVSAIKQTKSVWVGIGMTEEKEETHFFSLAEILQLLIRVVWSDNHFKIYVPAMQTHLCSEESCKASWLLSSVIFGLRMDVLRRDSVQS